MDARLVDRGDGGYVLTPSGNALVARLLPLMDWSRTWAKELETGFG